MMAKLNKTTHLMILFTFAIVFVVIYLYYTIGDVRKMSSEVKRLTGEVSKLNQDVQNILAIMPKMPSSASNLQIPVPSSSQTQVQVQQVQQQVQPVVQKQKVSASSQSLPAQPSVQATSQLVKQVLPDDSDEDDASSVNTEDLKKIINDVDEVNVDNVEDGHIEVLHDELPEQEGHVQLEQETVKEEVFSEEDLKKLKYEEIKDLCRTRGISTRGTKEQLIAKLVVV